MEPPPTRRLDAAVAALVAVASAAAVGLAVGAAGRTPDGDGAHLAAVELRLVELVRDGDLARAFGQFSALVAPHPPLGYVPGLLGTAALGPSPAGTLGAMALVLLLHAHAYWLLARRAAWAPWLLLLASPLTWLQVEQYGRDLVASAALAQTAAWLVAADGFRHRRATVLFGLSLGAAALAKYSAPGFLAGLVLAAGTRLVARTVASRADAAPRWANLGLGAAACLALTGAWLVTFGPRAVAYATHSVDHLAEAGQPSTAADGLAAALYYPLAIKDAVGWPTVGLLALGAGLGILRPAPGTSRGAVAYPLLGAAAGLAFLGSLTFAVDRYGTPALGLAVALAAPVAAWRWRGWPVGAAAVGAVGVPLLLDTVDRFAPGAPTHGARYDHSPATAAVLSWPSPRSYFPSDFDVAAWKLDEAVRALREVHGRDDGTVGLLMPVGAGLPSYGLFLQQAARAGMRWDVANVNLGWRPGSGMDEVFVGPLFDGTWPSGRFVALYAIVPDPAPPEVARWLAGRRLEERARFALPNRATGVVYAVSDAR